MSKRNTVVRFALGIVCTAIAHGLWLSYPEVSKILFFAAGGITYSGSSNV